MSNPIKLYIRDILINTSIAFTGGTIIQTFYDKIGLSSFEIGIYITAVNMINVLITVIFSNISDKAKKIKQPITLYTALASAITFGFIPLCFVNENISHNLLLYIVLLIGLVQALILALRAIYEYKFPYQIFEMKNYSSILATDGVLIGIVGIFPGIILSAFLKKYSYFSVMSICFIISALIMGAAAYVNHSFKIINGNTNSDIKLNKTSVMSSITALFRMKCFYVFIIPNFTRGIAMGIIGMAAVIGLREAGFTNINGPYIAAFAAAANVLGSIVYAFLTRRMNLHAVNMIGSIMASLFPLSILGGPEIFLIFYSAAAFGIMMVNYSVPCMVYKFIPQESAGIYNAWRMIMTTAGSALASTIIGILIGKIPIFLLLLSVPVSQMICAFFYSKYYKLFTGEKNIFY